MNYNLRLQHEFSPAYLNIDYPGQVMLAISHEDRRRFYAAVEEAFKRARLTGFSVRRNVPHDCEYYSDFLIVESSVSQGRPILGGLLGTRSITKTVEVCRLSSKRSMWTQQLPGQNFTDRHFKAIEVLMEVWENFK